MQTGQGQIAETACRRGGPYVFASTSKAAVSDRALSLRWSSRSSSLTRRRSCRASAALAARARSIGQAIRPPTRSNVATLPRLHVTHAPPTSSPAATAPPLSDLCTLVRIEPLPDIRALKVPILFSPSYSAHSRDSET